jgi:acetylornithine/succinyldiaminopimelate/putrescine aminotransferase
MMAVEYRQPVAARAVRALAAAGILAKDTRGRVVRLMPPLVVGEDVLAEALDAAIPVLAAAAA